MSTLKRYFIVVVILFVVFTLLLTLIILFDYFQIIRFNNSSFSFNIADKVLTLILYVSTVILLYRTYSLQKEEMKKLSKANRKMVKANRKMVLSNNKANEQQIVLSALNNFNYRFNDVNIQDTVYKLVNVHERYKPEIMDVSSHENSIEEFIDDVIQLNAVDLKQLFNIVSYVDRQINTLSNIIDLTEYGKLIYSSFPIGFAEVMRFLNKTLNYENTKMRIESDEKVNKDTLKISLETLNVLEKIGKRSDSIVKILDYTYYL